ncbi:MAG: hypothetical protein ABS84_14905 [Rubrivivax sp. SCN 71-131]|nr:MAG: hypothetical protein ABS84_14905 [Rubrivivax sp. SCN 71-131]
MPRYARNAVILAKIETTVGTDAVPDGATDALLVSELSITPLDATNVDLAYIRPYFGSSPQLVATATKKISFTVDLAGSGAAGTAPRLGSLLQGCAMAEAVLATPARVEYTPVSTGLKTLTIYAYDDGVLHKYLAAMGTAKLGAQVSDRPKLQFEFTALDGGETAAANPAATLTAWKTPVAMTKANVVDITLGATYATGAITGGTVYPSRGLDIDIGNSVQYTPMLSGESVDITDRQMAGSVLLDLSAAQEVTFMGTVKANALQSVALTIGTATGYKAILFAPQVQLINPSKQDVNGRRLIGFDMRLVPSAGNDELRIAFV